MKPRAAGKPSMRTRWRYRFDELMAAGASAQIIGLALLALLMIGVVGLIVEVFDLAPEHEGTTTVWYRELLRTLDPGTVAQDEGTWTFLFLMVMITFGGIFVVGALIGILSNAIDQRLKELRKGRSKVLERDHFVVLGWSPEIFTILRQLMLANRHGRGAVIVVLAPHDKVEMDDAIRTRLGHPGNIRIICRTGNPLDFDDLELVALDSCRAVIIVTPEHEEHPDALVIKTLLAITNAPGHRDERHHVVVELRDPSKLDIGNLAGRDQVEFVVSNTLTTRVVAQTCRNPGLSAALDELFDYAGDVIHLRAVPELTGLTFEQAIHRFETTALLGVQTADGTVRLRPPTTFVFSAGDRVVAVAESDDSIVADGRPCFDAAVLQPTESTDIRPERTLVLGRNRHLRLLIDEFDRSFPRGSEITIAHDYFVSSEAALGELETPQRVQLTFVYCHLAESDALEGLEPERYDHVVILSDDTLEEEHADAGTLMMLLHIRDLSRRSGVNLKIVTELNSERNKSLAQISADDDLIVSSQVVSEFIAHVVMDPVLQDVFDQLLSPVLCDLEMRPASDYVELGVDVAFSSVVEAAIRRGDVAFGHRRLLDSGHRTVLNPRKSSTATYGDDDQIVVLAEGVGTSGDGASSGESASVQMRSD